MLTKKIQNFVHKQNLWQPGAKIVVAVSGGADSSCLLDILTKLAPKYTFRLHVTHVNYGLRGKESEQDEKFVRTLAQKYALPFTVFSFPRATNKKYGEEELRNVRYAFFEKLRQDLNFDLIALAHNQDDQAETVLLRVLRGTGLQGLAAMKSKNGFLIRPLLNTSRKEILLYLAKHALHFRTDKTNKQSIYTRNKIRLGLLPYLEKHFNPKIKENLSAFSLLVAEDYSYLEKQAQAVLNFSTTPKGITFKAAWLLNLDASLQRMCLRQLILAAKKDLLGIEFAHVEEILKMLGSNKSKTQKISFQGLNITRKGATVYMLSIKK